MEPSCNSIGSSLRNRRLEMGISFEEVVTRTRIRRSYLEALEREEFETFPGDAYLKGYLKGYAECLGLDPQPLLDSLPSKTPSSQNSSLGESAPLPSLGGRTSRSPMPPRGGLLLLGLLVLLVLGWLLLGRESMAPQPLVVTPPAVDESRERQLAATVDEPVNPMEDRATQATESAIVATEIASATAAVETIPAATPAPTAASVEAATAALEPAASLPDAARSDAGVLRLQASGPGELELTIDGRPAQRYSLQANTILSWKVGRTVRVYLENPGSAKLWLGGREVDLAGRNQIVLQSTEESGR